MKRKWLIELREEADLSQERLAKEVGITRQMISAIENGAGTKAATAKKIASVLGCNWIRFFDESLREEGKKA